MEVDSVGDVTGAESEGGREKLIDCKKRNLREITLNIPLHLLHLLSLTCKDVHERIPKNGFP
jgi:hypothetical protein